jgi:hypothetical protein
MSIWSIRHLKEQKRKAQEFPATVYIKNISVPGQIGIFVNMANNVTCILPPYILSIAILEFKSV